MRTAPFLTATKFASVIWLCTSTSLLSSTITKADPPPKPSISCSNKACPRRNPHDVCHFGKIDRWQSGDTLHTRYNIFCEPTCTPPETTCWVAGFPNPHTANSIGWTKGSKPQEVYSYDLTAAHQGYVLELNF